MLSYVGWFNGLSTLGYVIFGCSFGSIILYKSIKLKSKLLSYLGLTIFFAGLLIFGAFCDFLSILLTGDNLDNTHGSNGILSAVWAAPAIVFGIYIGAELMVPKKKRYILYFYLVLSILFELFIFLDTANTFVYTYPKNPGEDLIDTHLVIRSPAGMIASFFLISLFIFNGFGFLVKGIQSTGIIRKKFLFLSIGYILYVMLFSLDMLIPLGIFIFLIRIALVGCFCLWYFGIREESVKIKIKILPPYKEFELDESHLSLIEMLTESKYAEISAEEISQYREQKICPVCKGKIEGFNIFICSKCDTRYCQNCARALAQLENMCWVCNEPIDESQPVKPLTESEVSEIKLTKKPEINKKPKKSK